MDIHELNIYNNYLLFTWKCFLNSQNKLSKVLYYGCINC